MIAPVLSLKPLLRLKKLVVLRAKNDYGPTKLVICRVLPSTHRILFRTILHIEPTSRDFFEQVLPVSAQILQEIRHLASIEFFTNRCSVQNGESDVCVLKNMRFGHSLCGIHRRSYCSVSEPQMCRLRWKDTAMKSYSQAGNMESVALSVGIQGGSSHSFNQLLVGNLTPEGDSGTSPFGLFAQDC
jgi:hypothetical protein